MHFGLLGTVQNIVHYNKAIVQFLLDDKEETAILLGNASCTLYSEFISSKQKYSYSIRGNFQSRILFEYLNIFVLIFPNIGLSKPLEILELKEFHFHC